MKKIFLLILFLPFIVHAQIITTYVGNGISGDTGDGNPAVMAEIESPYGLNIDNLNNLLVCHNNLIRSVNDLTEIISTIAGSDTASSLGGGGDGGPALCASLVAPYAVCVDAAGNYYIADQWFSEIRKVDIATGIIDTFAGCREVGSTGDGGPAKSAKFNTIGCVCIDTDRGYLFISDEYNHRIRMVNMSTGIINAYAGTGTNGYLGDNGLAINAQFSRVLGITLDHAGNLYICDWDNARIRKVEVVTGIVTTIAGTGTIGYGGDDSLATNAMINKPTYLCFDKCDNLYFSDELNQRVRRIDAITGIITTIAGNGTAGFSGDSSLATTAQLNNPSGVTIDTAGNLYVGDYSNQRVRKIALGACTPHADTTTAVRNVTTVNNISVYPNPTNEVLHIDNVQTPSTYNLLNMLGKEIKAGYLKAGNNEISMDALPVGVYVLQLNSKVYKIVKE